VVNGSKGRTTTICLFAGLCFVAVVRAILLALHQSEAATSLDTIIVLFVGVFGGAVVIQPNATSSSNDALKTIINEVLKSGVPPDSPTVKSVIHEVLNSDVPSKSSVTPSDSPPPP